MAIFSVIVIIFSLQTSILYNDEKELNKKIKITKIIISKFSCSSIKGKRKELTEKGKNLRKNKGFVTVSFDSLDKK